MAKVIKTAAQVVRSQINQDRYSAAEERQHKLAIERERSRLESYEDLRDDVLSVIKNSGMSYHDIHGRCGPHPSTLENLGAKPGARPSTWQDAGGAQDRRLRHRRRRGPPPPR